MATAITIPATLTMNQIIQRAYQAGFEDYWSGLESNQHDTKAGMAKSFLTNLKTGDVVEVWEDGSFDIYNQHGDPVTFHLEHLEQY